MSGASHDLDLLAAEYVLGTLDAAQARELATRADKDASVRAAIAAWEERLAPLGRVGAPVTPPPALWQRIAVSAGLHHPPPASQPSLFARAWQSLLLWRTVAGGSLALAAAFAAVTWIGGGAPSTRPVAALVPRGSAAAAYVAEIRPNGRLVLIALQQIPVAQGKSLELWALPKGARRPVSLGLLSATGRGARNPAPPPGSQLMISLEPFGGSPTGLPTGPVLFAGTLRS